MLQLKVEAEIRLFNVFFLERKRDSGFRRKKVRDAGFPWKRSGILNDIQSNEASEDIKVNLYI